MPISNEPPVNAATGRPLDQDVRRVMWRVTRCGGRPREGHPGLCGDQVSGAGQCLVAADPEEAPMTEEELEKLFLALV